MKKIFGLILALTLGLGGMALAVVEAGNTTCPVSGDKVSGKHFVEYQGKRYGLCCRHCEKEFNKDPEKFIASMGNPGAHLEGGHSH